MLIQNKALCDLILKNSNGSDILQKISNFIKEYYDNTTNNIINPIEIKKIIESKQEIFQGFQQQDSTEFILYLINIIDEELHGIKTLFGIELNVRVKCKLKNCLKIYNHKEESNILLLDIQSDTNTLDDAYRNFKSSEKLDNDNKYFCENCNTKIVASKRTEITLWPNYLFIWLKRYSQNGKYITKNSQDIKIPLKWRHDLELQGGVIHYGNLNGGHYVYIGKYNNKWYIFNDSSVNEIGINELEIQISKAYWLWYKK